MLNTITLMGRLTKDPELRTTPNGKTVVSFTLAVDRDYDREKTDFFSCNAWEKTGEFVANHFRKGQLMVLSGQMQSRSFKDKAGNNRTAWDVKVNGVWFGSAAEKKPVDVTFEELADDDEVELPF